MILDRGHRRWARFTVAALVVSTAVYLVHAGRSPDGPRGGSAVGLAFGIAGSALILFAALLGVRKRRPHYRWGRASTWLKGHLWLGALSLPLILYHGGFRFGGTLTQVVMWLFLLVFFTGVVGLGLQQVLPRLMTRNVAQETVFEQLEEVREQLRDEAVALVRGEAAGGSRVRAKDTGAIRGRVVRGRSAEPQETDAPDREPLRRFFSDHADLFLGVRPSVRLPLSDPHRRKALFSELARVCDPRLHEAVADFEAICEQRAQLETQRRLHLCLHGWLLVHVPLSWTMILLAAVHAVTALYY